MKRITVIGSGFGGLTAVRMLRAFDTSAVITVIAPQPQFVFLPSLIWIPSGLRQPQDLRIPLDGFFRRHGAHFHQGEVVGLAEGGRRVLTSNGEVANDGLIIASGGRYLKKLPGIEHALVPCEGIEAATAMRDRLASMQGGTIAMGFASNPNESSAMRGGPVFEFLFGLHTQLKRSGQRGRFKLVFFSPAAQPGQRLGAKAVGRLLQGMAARNIDTHLGHKLKAFEADRVVTEGGEFGADLILFMPGMTGSQWLDATDLPRSPGGFVQADAHCKVPGLERVYVVGDAGSFPGPEWMPKQAHMADLQGESAAANLIAEMDDLAPHKTFKTEMACLLDTLDQGTLVIRNPKHNFMLPLHRLGHWTKRVFEWWYLRPYR